MAARQVTQSSTDSIEMRYHTTLSEILPNILPGEFALIPIENRYGGVVHDTALAIYQHRDEIRVLGWTTLKINHCLACKPGATVQSITKVYSHLQGLLQCQISLKERYSHMQQSSASSTTAMAGTMTEKDAIICGQDAARQLNLEILDTHMAPEDNITHFALLGHRRGETPESLQLTNDRAIAIISLSDSVGSLAMVLELIAKAGLSLHFIESMANGKGWYDFPIVVDQKENALRDVQKKMAEEGLGRLQIL